MLAEMSIHPQVGRDIRREVAGALEEIERAGLKHEVEPFGTAVEGDLEQILAGCEPSTAACVPRESTASSSTSVSDRSLARRRSSVRPRGSASAEPEYQGSKGCPGSSPDVSQAEIDHT